MRFSALITAAAGLAVACAANAQSMPPMGGTMRHIMVERIGDDLHVHVEPGEPPLLQNYGETYAAPADVLDGKWFSAQYGWMAEGFWEPPAGASVWFQLVEQTAGLESYRAMTFAPIFTTEGSAARLRWDGRMMHNWYASPAPRAHEATYLVYFGDELTGEPLPGYTPGEVTLRWDAPCRIDLDGDGALTFFDFLEFQALFAAGDLAADFDGDSALTFFDFLAFQEEFAAGCN